MTWSKPSPAVLVAVLALTAALGGSAVAEVATTSKLSKSETRRVGKIAKKKADDLTDPSLQIAFWG